MKPHPRIRKTIRWGGAAVTVLLVVVWVGSRWIGMGFCDQRHTGVGVGLGVLMIDYEESRPSDAPRAFHFGFNTAEIPRWQWEHVWLRQTIGRRWFMLHVPLWMCIVPASMSVAVAWTLDTLARRRAKVELCVKCGYDRTGLAQDAMCPECGSGRVSA